MKKLPSFNPGDRVAYNVRFLKDTGQQVGSGGFRRGTFVGPYSASAAHGRVKWDDLFTPEAASLAKCYGEDWLDDARANGAVVALSALAKVGLNTDFCAC